MSATIGRVTSPWVIKVGGALCEEPGACKTLARACAQVPAPLVLVHGGGRQVSRLQTALGHEVRFVAGRRATTADDLVAVEMALSGSTNPALVRALTAAGRRAVGLSGCDGRMVRCDLVPELGRVGTPVTVDPSVLHTLLAAGLTPVISPVSLGPDGEAVNVNADEMASALAIALGAGRLLLLSDVTGVEVHGECQREIAHHEVEPLVAAGDVAGGMIPKLRAAAAAAAGGVEEVRITSFDGRPLADLAGTRVRGESVERTGAAEVSAGRSPISESQVLASVFHYPRLLLVRGEGAWVWDGDGRPYLDFTAGLGIAALGHGRRDLAAALGEEFANLGNCSNLYANLPALELAQTLKESSFAARVWFANSGTEAVEAALKFSRLHGRAIGAHKSRVVAFKGGFHGRTLGALSATHEPRYRRPFTPLVPGMRFAAFNDLESAARAIDDQVCAVLVEPVQGEGGVVPATPEFLHGLRTLCNEHRALLVFDEVQCGLGRLGHLHAYQAYGVVPDLATLAKPLAAGLPLGAVLIGDQVAGHLEPGHHGSTFAGGPAVCAVAQWVLSAISEPAFLARVQALGRRLRSGLDELSDRSPLFRAARGRGLMQALVLSEPRRFNPADLVQAAREGGLLVTRAGRDAVRLLPPLNVSQDEIDQAITILSHAATRIRRPRRAAVRGHSAVMAAAAGSGRPT